MYAWSDMAQVKKELWNKLHQVKSAMKDGVTNLAQVMINHAHSMKKKMQGGQDGALFLSQTEVETDSEKSKNKYGRRRDDTGISSTK